MRAVIMLHRRDAMLRLGQFGLGALTLTQLLQADRLRAAASNQRTGHSGGRAKSCILIYLWGGLPQQDLWDMKPESPTADASKVPDTFFNTARSLLLDMSILR